MAQACLNSLQKAGVHNMDKTEKTLKAFRYHHKFVHDLPVDDALVRLWDAEGAVNGDMIRSTFRPLVATGFIWPYVALMPDYHPGEGSMIGSVIPTRQVILPSVIGGDVGCGMTAVRLPLEAERVLPVLQKIETMVRAAVPVGTAHNAYVTERVQRNPIWRRARRKRRKCWRHKRNRRDCCPPNAWWRQTRPRTKRSIGRARKPG